eukprot:scaffold207767_cov30-Tisochrysis_lutea.AAC.1
MLAIIPLGCRWPFAYSEALNVSITFCETASTHNVVMSSALLQCAPLICHSFGMQWAPSHHHHPTSCR